MSEVATYRHSGKFAPSLILVGAGLAVLASLPLAWLYALGIYYIPFVYLNVLLTLGFGWGLGALVVWVLRGCRVRNTTLALLTALGVTAFAFYFHWAAWVSAVLGSGDVEVGVLEAALQPAALWSVVLAINETGAWGFGESAVAGGPLWAVWGIEAVLVFGVALFWTHHAFQDVPYCEDCDSWCEKERNVARLTGPDPGVILDAVTGKDFAALATFPRVPLDADAGGWLEFDCECCPKCGRTNTLDASLVAIVQNSKGQDERKEQGVLQNFLVTREEIGQIRALADPVPAPDAMPAGGAAPVGGATPEI